MESILGFKGEYEWLSNFYPCKIEYKGYIFDCSEALYMAHKSGDEEDFELFVGLNGAQSKRMGKSIVLRKDWDDVKYDVMLKCVTMKFEQNPELADLLINTGDKYIIEDNWWKDTYWGVCNGVGENNLGKILMIVRDKLIESR